VQHAQASGRYVASHGQKRKTGRTELLVKRNNDDFQDGRVALRAAQFCRGGLRDGPLADEFQERGRGGRQDRTVDRKCADLIQFRTLD